MSERRPPGRALVLVAALVTACAPPDPAAASPLRGSPFECGDRGCTQAYPALPDDGEWECRDTAGVVVCLGGIAAAGVRPGAPDVSFACGERPGDEHGRRVCVDVHGDVPDGDLAAWRCHFDREGGREVRRCDRADGRAGLGARCGSCPEGLRCDEGRCVLAGEGPPRCWLDTDCGGARCVLGRCEGT